MNDQATSYRVDQERAIRLDERDRFEALVYTIGGAMDSGASALDMYRAILAGIRRLDEVELEAVEQSADE